MSSTKREDLQALRGLAILAVLLFHLKVDFFKNGHFGVDIFFVLSGYFIFSGLCDSVDCQRVSSFYSKRIWRIFPAYFTVLAFTTIGAIHFLIPTDFIFYVQELRKAAGFVTNWQFDAEKDYFAEVQEHYFLLHTWSLSVEIQFYCLAPIIALILLKVSKYVVIIFIIASVGSYLIASPKMAFYLLPCRMWQFLPGFIIASSSKNEPKYSLLSSEDDKLLNEGKGVEDESCDFGTKNDDRVIVPVHGLRQKSDNNATMQTNENIANIYESYCKLAFSPDIGRSNRNMNADLYKTLSVFSLIFVVLLSNFQQHLFMQRILVTLLASYVIHSSSNQMLWMDNIWNNKVTRFFGEISYSWYLFHWPFMVLIFYFDLNIIDEEIFAVYALAPFGLATFSTYAIEKPLIALKPKKIWTILTATVLPFAFVLGTSYYLYRKDRVHFPDGTSRSYISNEYASALGFDPRGIEMTPRYRSATERYRPCMGGQWIENNCFVGTKNATNHTVVWGDSHGVTAFVAHKMLPETYKNARVTLLASTDCRPITKCNIATETEGACKSRTNLFAQKLSSMNASKVILAARYISTYRLITSVVKKENKAREIFEECVHSTVRTLIQIGVPKIVLVMPVPEAREDVVEYMERAEKFGLNITQIQIARTTYENMMKGVIQSMKNIAKECSVCSTVDPADMLCDKKTCHTTFAMNGTDYPLYWDSNHLSDFGIRKLLNIYRLHD